MSKRCTICIITAWILFTGFQLGKGDSGRKLGYFSLQEYQQRRVKLMAKIPDGIMVLLGAQYRTSYHHFFQNNDFMYLSGVEIPNAILVIDGIKRETLLFYTITNYEARSLGIKQEILEDPRQMTGIDQVCPYAELESYLNRRLKTVKTLYTLDSPEELSREASHEKYYYLMRNLTKNPWDQRLIREKQFNKILKQKYPDVELKDCSKLIWDLRIIKTPAEIELLRKAGKIGVKAHIALMKATKVGLPEYKLAALFEYLCKNEGAQELAYNTLICSDENHAYAHYHKYDRILQDGDFLVIDGGPDLHYYDIDITISYPVNGKFTPRQREIYLAAKAVHEACLSIYKPGLSKEEAKKKVREILTKQGFDLEKEIFKARGMQWVFGHYVGMAVHDVGGSPQVLKEGMVFANEPMAIFADEKLGVRIENTILITKNGCEVLTPGIPREIEDIEALMKKAQKK